MKLGDRVLIIDHDPDESPALVGQEATVVGDGGGSGVRVRTEDGTVRWFWRTCVRVVGE